MKAIDFPLKKVIKSAIKTTFQTPLNYQNIIKIFNPSCALAPKDSWFNAYGVGNPPFLNNNVPPALARFPNSTYVPVNSSVTIQIYFSW